MDSKALKILLKYDTLDPKALSDSDFNYAKSTGYMFDDIMQTHDEAIDIAFCELEKCDKRKATDLFLASLSSHNLDWRIGLPTLAIMQTFPRHYFEHHDKKSSQLHCKVCCSEKKSNVDLNFINQVRFTCGGIVGYDIYDFSFLLSQQNKLVLSNPNAEDYQIFNEIIGLILQAPDDEKPNTLQKKLRTIKGFKSTEQERRCLLETLGFCSILETDKHKGFLTKFTDMNQSPRNGRSSDWLYPFDWWKGKDGINKSAFAFWFGEYDELKITGI